MSAYLDISAVEQSNDALTILFTDGTSWGGDNPAKPPTSSGYVELVFRIETPLDDITYDAIKYGTGGLTWPTADTFIITADMLKVSTTAQFTSGDKLPDGVWHLTYTYGAAVDTYTEDYIVTGTVEIDIFNDFTRVPTTWDKKQLDYLSDDILELLRPLQKLTYLEAIEAEPYTVREDEVLNILGQIQNLSNEE